MQYCSAPMSRRDIRALAFNFRRLLGLEDALCFPVLEALEMMHLVFREYHFEVVEMDGLQNKRAHGETDIVNSCIRLRADVYERASEGNGRDRMTAAHELGHFITLRPYAIKLSRCFDGANVEPFRDPEWQANCFAGELLIPKHLVAGMSVNEVVRACGVTPTAAAYQLKKFKEEEVKNGKGALLKKKASRNCST